MIDLSNIRAIVFDLDGTLYDSSRLPLRLVLGDVRNMWTLGAERQVRKQLMGKDFGTSELFYDTFFKAIAAKRKISVENVKHWFHESYMPLMVAILQMYYQARPMAEEVLFSLRAKGIRLIVLSDYGYVEEKMSAVGIDPTWVDASLDAPAFGGLKPCREVMERIMQQYDLQSETTLVIGDRLDTDGAIAQNVGMPFCHLNSAQVWDELIVAAMQ